MRAWTALIWLGIWANESGGSCENDNGLTNFIKYGEFD
jgi:hypothetical protein